MFLAWIKLKNFRTFEEIKLDFSQGINVFLGNNGEGKTNLLEAIYLLGISRSFRTHRDADMIKWGEGFFVLTGQILRDNLQSRIELSYLPPQKKVRINEKNLPRMIDLIGQLRVVLFWPDDIYLIKGMPALRRQFINILISQTNPKYLFALQSYQNILRQRNEILMQLRERPTTARGATSSLRRELEVWSEQLVETGSYLTRTRACVIKEINPLAQTIHTRITNGLEKVEITYKPSLKSENGSELEKIQREEIRRGQTLIGPHRDDILFYLNGVDTKRYSSQGQQRTTAISLRLAEVDYIYSQLNDYPLLLLDDVASELDTIRREYLFSSIRERKGMQTFITTTALEGLGLIDAEAALLEFVAGEVKRTYE